MAAHDHPSRKKIRHPLFDYTTEGAYFITSCIRGRERLFGEILDGKVQLSEAGKIVEKCWLALPNHYTNCTIDPAFVIMPDHFHGIIWIKNPDFVRTGLGPVPAGEPGEGEGFKPSPTKLHGLPEIMRGCKTFSAKEINKKFPDLSFRWQRSYHDRIIRNKKEYDNIRNYIQENPSRWKNS